MIRLCVILFLFATTTSLSGANLILPKDSIQKDSLLKFCKKHLGSNYNYASCDPSSGFDCSGFVYYVFTHFKVKVPRSSSEFGTAGKTIPSDSARVGDVIVFTGTNAKKRSPGHVGIVISNPGEELQFIHSSSSKKQSGVKISSYKESPYYKVRFLKIVRVATIYKKN
jgi:cell wall-associated NlpC family hydrolase